MTSNFFRCFVVVAVPWIHGLILTRDQETGEEQWTSFCKFQERQHYLTRQDSDIIELNYELLPSSPGLGYQRSVAVLFAVRQKTYLSADLKKIKHSSVELNGDCIDIFCVLSTFRNAIKVCHKTKTVL